jgi:cytochrome c peroxidase
MFPVQSGTEIAGQPGENSVADAAAIGDLAGPSGVWAQLAARVAGIPEYVSMLSAAFDDVNGAGDIRFSHIANAIAAYEGSAFRADNSPYDRYLAGDRSALSQSARHGMRLFYGAAGCSDCHSGRFQTDHQFHAIAMPQIGPGKGDNLPGFTDGRDDFGRERVTGDTSDRFKFRTPSLRNVALSGPWGHSGAYESLEAVVRHHLDPVNSLLSYDESQLDLPKRADLDAIDLVVMNDPARVGAIASASDLFARNLNDVNLERLMDFLHALTDPASLDVRHTIPRTVPSGLPVFD